MKLEVFTEQLRRNSMYDIGFVNSDGVEDETQFGVCDNPKEDLEECWEGFCKENLVQPDSVLYVEYAGEYVEEV